MKSTKRALRRHHRRRMIGRAYHSYFLLGWPEWERWAQARRLHDDLTPCSCHMCGNPRKWWNERTVQERRWHEAARQEQDNI